MESNAPVHTYGPGDPFLVNNIVSQLKSEGLFDQFRKECIADVDTKPAYQNLKQRVELYVKKYLSKLIWNPKMNKNQLRESIRKHMSECPFLDPGVDRVVEQVLNPKINPVLVPKVEAVVFQTMEMIKSVNDDIDEIEEETVIPEYPETIEGNWNQSEIEYSKCYDANVGENKDNVTSADKYENNSTVSSKNDVSVVDEDDDETSPPFEPINVPIIDSDQTSSQKNDDIFGTNETPASEFCSPEKGKHSFLGKEREHKNTESSSQKDKNCMDSNDSKTRTSCENMKMSSHNTRCDYENKDYKDDSRSHEKSRDEYRKDRDLREKDQRSRSKDRKKHHHHHHRHSESKDYHSSKKYSSSHRHRHSRDSRERRSEYDESDKKRDRSNEKHRHKDKKNNDRHKHDKDRDHYRKHREHEGEHKHKKEHRDEKERSRSSKKDSCRTNTESYKSQSPDKDGDDSLPPLSQNSSSLSQSSKKSSEVASSTTEDKIGSSNDTYKTSSHSMPIKSECSGDLVTVDSDGRDSGSKSPETEYACVYKNHHNSVEISDVSQESKEEQQIWETSKNELNEMYIENKCDTSQVSLQNNTESITDNNSYVTKSVVTVSGGHETENKTKEIPTEFLASTKAQNQFFKSIVSDSKCDNNTDNSYTINKSLLKNINIVPDENSACEPQSFASKGNILDEGTLSEAVAISSNVKLSISNCCSLCFSSASGCCSKHEKSKQISDSKILIQSSRYAATEEIGQCKSDSLNSNSDHDKNNNYTEQLLEGSKNVSVGERCSLYTAEEKKLDQMTDVECRSTMYEVNSTSDGNDEDGHNTNVDSIRNDNEYENKQTLATENNLNRSNANIEVTKHTNSVSSISRSSVVAKISDCGEIGGWDSNATNILLKLSANNDGMCSDFVSQVDTNSTVSLRKGSVETTDIKNMDLLLLSPNGSKESSKSSGVNDSFDKCDSDFDSKDPSLIKSVLESIPEKCNEAIVNKYISDNREDVTEKIEEPSEQNSGIVTIKIKRRNKAHKKSDLNNVQCSNAGADVGSKSLPKNHSKSKLDTKCEENERSALSNDINGTSSIDDDTCDVTQCIESAVTEHTSLKLKFKKVLGSFTEVTSVLGTDSNLCSENSVKMHNSDITEQNSADNEEQVQEMNTVSSGISGMFEIKDKNTESNEVLRRSNRNRKKRRFYDDDEDEESANERIVDVAKTGTDIKRKKK